MLVFHVQNSQARAQQALAPKIRLCDYGLGGLECLSVSERETRDRLKGVLGLCVSGGSGIVWL